MPDADRVVRARRAGFFERAKSGFERYFLPACVVVTLLVAWWFIGAIRSGLGEHLVGAFFFGLVALFSGAFSVAFFIALFEGSTLVGPCPRCGVEGTRSFAKELPAECEGCGAYLRASGLEVREEPAGSRLDWPCFRVGAARFDAIGELVFPPQCAVCGAPAKGRAAIRIYDPAARAPVKKDGGLVDAADLGLTNRLRTGPHGAPLIKDEGGSSTETNARLRGQSFPICGTDHGLEAHYAVADFKGQLGFASYDYYRAFCAANGIGEAKKQ